MYVQTDTFKCMPTILKKRIEVYDAEICEWGNELIRVVPFIYHRFLMNRDIQINTTESMQPFYYFLNENDIKIKYGDRWDMKGVKSEGIPKQNLYEHDLNDEFWTPPPFKRVFAKSDILYPKRKFKPEKPTIIVSNKYNMEWNFRAINHIPLDVLNDLFNLLKKTFNIIYNRLDPLYIKQDRDTLKHKEFEDKELLLEHPEVIDVNSLFRLNRFVGIDITTFQLRMFANADRYINVQGGLGHFASFFGGRQLFFFERNGHRNLNGSQTRTLQAWHHKTGGAEIRVGNHVSVYDHFDWISEWPIKKPSEKQKALTDQEILLNLKLRPDVIDEEL